MNITYELESKPQMFGNNWSIVLKKGLEVKTFWLGQDVKVISRLLGMRMSDAVEYYKNKAGSESFDVIKRFIAADILRAILNTQRLTQEQLETAFNANVWDMAVE